MRAAGRIALGLSTIALLLITTLPVVAQQSEQLSFSRDSISKQGVWILTLADFTSKLANNLMNAQPDQIELAELILDNAESMNAIGQNMVNRDIAISTAESVTSLGEVLGSFAESLDLARSAQTQISPDAESTLESLGAVNGTLQDIATELQELGAQAQASGGSLNIQTYRDSIRHLIFVFTAFQKIQQGTLEGEVIEPKLLSNQATTVENTTSQIINFDASTSLDSQGTLDPAEGFLWDFGDGTRAMGAFAAHVYSKPNTYQVKLFVNGPSGFALQETTVAVAPVYPMAHITTDQETGFGPHPDTLSIEAGEMVKFSGATSFDPNNASAPLSYAWDFGDGTVEQSGTAKELYHVFDTPGTYSVRLQVSNDALTGFAVKTVKVTPRGPVATILLRGENADEYEPAEKDFWTEVFVEPLEVVVSADASLGAPLDTAGRSTLSTFHWEFGDGTQFDQSPTQVTAGTAVPHVYEEAGTYVLTLTVTDSAGLTDTRRKVIHLIPREIPRPDFIARPWHSVDTETPLVLDGTASVSQGGIQSYVWEIRDSVRSVVRTVSDAKISHTFTLPGTYEVSLAVTNTAGVQSPRAAQRVIVTSHAPTADFEWNIKPGNPNTVTFDASDSFDADQDDTLVYSWDFNTDGSFEIQRSADPTITRVFDTVGVSRVTLQVSDRFNATDTTTAEIRIGSTLVAEITLAETSANVGKAPLEVTVSGSGYQNLSTGKDYNEVSHYTWDFGDSSVPEIKSNVTGRSDTVTHEYTAPGEYKLSLTVKDRAGKTARAVLPIYVSDGQSPLAIVKVTPDSTLPGSTNTTYVFDGSMSVNARGTSGNLSLSWDFGDNSPIETGTSAQHRFAEQGTYTVTLSVLDQTAKRIDKSTVLITIGDQPAVVHYTATPTTGKAPLTVLFDATQTVDPDGPILDYLWEFGDGVVERSSSNPKTTHRYAKPGTYEATLTVTDEHRVKITPDPVILIIE